MYWKQQTEFEVNLCRYRNTIPFITENFMTLEFLVFLQIKSNIYQYKA